jgi:hypothetical protein
MMVDVDEERRIITKEFVNEKIPKKRKTPK